MARVAFSKWQGTGNDFILVDDRADSFPSTDLDLVRRLCDRHFGIGSDGLILIQRPRIAGTAYHMEFFNPDGSQGSVLTARKGLIKPRKNRMEVRDHVVFTNALGERLETEHLVWSQDSDRVWTDQPVKIVRAQDILYGQGLDANEDFSRYTIRRLTGTLYVRPGDTLGGTQR